MVEGPDLEFPPCDGTTGATGPQIRRRSTPVALRGSGMARDGDWTCATDGADFSRPLGSGAPGVERRGTLHALPCGELAVALFPVPRVSRRNCGGTAAASRIACSLSAERDPCCVLREVSLRSQRAELRDRALDADIRRLQSRANRLCARRQSC